MFERPRAGERALLVHWAPDNRAEEERDRAEFRELAAAAGAVCVGLVTVSRRCPEPRFSVGSGKAEEIRTAVLAWQAELVIVSHELAPGQQRNLEAFLDCRVVDRSGLILDIFAQRAHSFEGKLQVELAQLSHLSTRLVRGWTHLERQRGGIGLRGPGETQLESDRRLVAERIKQIQRRLHKVARQRQQGRRARRKAELPVVALVGYTNAGKSTLFNRLTAAGVYTAGQLFATLDPTLRRLALPNAATVVVADTVGFIRRLPHELITAFRSTLQETSEASLLLHVIDASDPQYQETAEQVERVLRDIGAQDVARLDVCNKIDRLGEPPRVERDRHGQVRAVRVSAASGAGVDQLLEAIGERLPGTTVHRWVRLPPEAAGRLRARLFSLGAVVTEQLNPNGEWLIEMQTSRQQFRQLCHREGLREEWLCSPR